MIFDGRKLTTLVMFTIFAGASLLALDLPTKAAFMPLLIGIPGAILCAAQFVVDLRAGPDAGGPPANAPEQQSDDDSQSEVQAFVWLAAFTVMLLCFGFIVGGPIVVGAFLRFSSRESWQNSLFAAGGTFAVLYGVFVWLLELSLFQGVVLEMMLR